MKNPTSGFKYYYPKNNKIRTRFTYRFLRTLKQVNTRRYNKNGHLRSSCRRNGITRRSLEIKKAANMCMAATVGSKRAWSRAMLSKRRSRSSSVQNELNNEDEICSTQELREIVPGGEGLDSKSLLDETAHYIKCLATQVQVMKDILHLYSSSS